MPPKSEAARLPSEPVTARIAHNEGGGARARASARELDPHREPAVAWADAGARQATSAARAYHGDRACGLAGDGSAYDEPPLRAPDAGDAQLRGAARRARISGRRRGQGRWGGCVI